MVILREIDFLILLQIFLSRMPYHRVKRLLQCHPIRPQFHLNHPPVPLCQPCHPIDRRITHLSLLLCQLNQVFNHHFQPCHQTSQVRSLVRRSHHPMYPVQLNHHLFLQNPHSVQLHAKYLMECFSIGILELLPMLAIFLKLRLDFTQLEPVDQQSGYV